MSRRRAIGLGLLAGVFTVMGVALMLLGDGPQRLGGLVVVLMFGGTGGALAVGHAIGRNAVGLRNGTVELPGGTKTRALILPVPRARLLGSVVGLVSFALAATVTVLVPESLDVSGVDRWLMGACAVGAWAIALLISRALRGPGQMLALTPTGILVRTAEGGSYVPWDALAGAHLFEMRGLPFLGIDVDDMSQVQRESRPRWLQVLERSLTGKDLSVPVSQYAAPPEEVVALLERYRSDPAARAELGRGPRA